MKGYKNPFSDDKEKKAKNPAYGEYFTVPFVFMDEDDNGHIKCAGGFVKYQPMSNGNAICLWSVEVAGDRDAVNPKFMAIRLGLPTAKNHRGETKTIATRKQFVDLCVLNGITVQVEADEAAPVPA